MTRSGAQLLFGALLALLIAGPGFSAEAPDDEQGDPGFASAARGGRFTEIPPSGSSFPKDLLATMRRKLGGERPTPETTQSEAPSNGH